MHLAIGLIGNVAFVAGSVLFLLQIRLPSSVLFLVGSCGMLLGRTGELLARHERSRLHDRA